jgi:hypothetical protein
MPFLRHTVWPSLRFAGPFHCLPLLSEPSRLGFTLPEGRREGPLDSRLGPFA